jgi:heme/copper-type cytochrome/quinol oxidase subunit 2
VTGRCAGLLGLALLAGILLAFGPMGVALAQDAMVGAPIPWGIGLQPSGGPIKDAISSFNSLVFWIIVGITIFVFLLLVYVVWKFRAEVNPNPTRTSHNTTLEIAWTVVPVLILVIIAIPSFRLIYYHGPGRWMRTSPSTSRAASGTGTTATPITATSPSTATRCRPRNSRPARCGTWKWTTRWSSRWAPTSAS